MRYEGVSNANDDPDAGFRAATRAAVDDYWAKNGAPTNGEPVRLKVLEMYVEVRNPIHDYIVVLGSDAP